MVWTTPATPTIAKASRGRRDAAIARGSDTAIPAISATSASSR